MLGNSVKRLDGGVIYDELGRHDPCTLGVFFPPSFPSKSGRHGIPLGAARVVIRMAVQIRQAFVACDFKVLILEALNRMISYSRQ